MIRSFLKFKKRLHFGRFDLETTEKQKMIKAILANSDNCGDLICGNPQLVKNIIKFGDKHNNNKSFEPYQYSSINIEKNKISPELCCEYFNFKKCDNCIMDK